MAVVADAEAKAAQTPGTSPPAARIGWIMPPLVLALYALKPLGPIKDPDAFWHIVAGEHLLGTGQFVLEDPLGAATEKIWILNQWLPEVLMHWAHTAYGLPGVAWLLCLTSLLVGLSVYAACRRRSSALVTALVLAVAFVALSGSLSPRPQLVTFALAAITTSTWLLTREDGRARWWLVPLTWLWACSHGMWFVGPVIGGVVVVGMLLERRVTLRHAARLAVVPALSVAVAALTPVGPRLFSSPFQVSGVTAMISEWQPPGLTDPGLVAALLLVAVVVVDQVVRGRGEWTVALLTVLALALAVTWSRTTGLAAVVLAPLAALAIQRLTRQQVSGVPRRERVAVLVSGAVSLVLAGALAPAAAASPGIGPNGLDAALARLPAGTVVCNDQADGGWLMLQHPGLRATMDTRVELYSVERIRAYLGFIAAEPGWQSYPEQVGCTYAALPADAAVVSAMRATGVWQLVEQAGGYALLRSRG
ncbi:MULTISPECIES: hypothetical protein [unclassified Terrabacter]|uniref:hypothetical protein n=1 Tax=unclassified Terrabacter TaxID=2630222 RepID=UPI0006FDC5A6|nr:MULTISPECIES: hypothetical protein [unclassified Terrabacter]KRB43856.1 hypothetical protein ASD90_19775 [Terrabacter sp. Root181]KRF46789.1 hypothetical protein ASG96_01795 [Terrabacter sp. Soil810]